MAKYATCVMCIRDIVIGTMCGSSGNMICANSHPQTAQNADMLTTTDMSDIGPQRHARLRSMGSRH